MAGGHSVWRHTWACVVQTGRLGQVCERKAIHQFVYKNLDLVKVSNLQMVDDLIDIQECGFKSEASNMFIKNQIEMKLLPLHKDKFKKIHIGQEFELCPILKVHDDDSDIKLVTEDKFLVDIVSNDIPPQTDVLCMTTSSLYGLFSHM